MRPVRPSRVSQPFADRGSYASRDDHHGRAGHHTGIDYGSAWPIPINRRLVRAVLPGEVVISGWNSWAGNWVGVYNHRRNLLVTYWHLSGRAVRVGEWVEVYQVLGRVGSSGNSTAPHLHMQVNPGPTFSYHSHMNPWVVLKIWRRRDARRRWRREKRRRRRG